MNPAAPTARSVSVRALAAVLGQGQSLDDALEYCLAPLSDRRERAFAQALCYGVVRWLPRLQALLQQLLHKPLKAKEYEVHALLLCGLYQHLYMRVPPHAATAATVEVAHRLDKPWAVGLVNAVLRNFLRRREALLESIDRDDSARLAHPGWWLESLRQAWPRHWQALVEANNQQPPMTLRVNLRRHSREEYLARLVAAGLEAEPTPFSAAGLTLAEAVDVSTLPGFAEGDVSVQDQAAQLAAHLLQVPEGARVLDACAAPGGKTAHLLEHYPQTRMLALDASKARTEQLRATLQRLGLEAETVCADAARPNTWWDGKGFARILLDAPCSGSGVIRRHPDIKYLRRADDIPRLAQRQRALLEALWPLLEPGGMLLYVTCSVLPPENAEQISGFLARHPDARAPALDAEWGHALPVGRQSLPGEYAMDGFYYACVHKV